MLYSVPKSCIWYRIKIVFPSNPVAHQRQIMSGRKHWEGRGVSAWHERDDCYINLIFLLHIFFHFCWIALCFDWFKGRKKVCQTFVLQHASGNNDIFHHSPSWWRSLGQTHRRPVGHSPAGELTSGQRWCISRPHFSLGDHFVDSIHGLWISLYFFHSLPNRRVSRGRVINVQSDNDTGESIGVLISFFATAHAHCPVQGVEVTFTSGFELS